MLSIYPKRGTFGLRTKELKAKSLTLNPKPLNMSFVRVPVLSIVNPGLRKPKPQPKPKSLIPGFGVEGLLV